MHARRSLRPGAASGSATLSVTKIAWNRIRSASTQSPKHANHCRNVRTAGAIITIASDFSAIFKNSPKTPNLPTVAMFRQSKATTVSTISKIDYTKVNSKHARRKRRVALGQKTPAAISHRSNASHAPTIFAALHASGLNRTAITAAHAITNAKAERRASTPNAYARGVWLFATGNASIPSQTTNFAAQKTCVSATIAARRVQDPKRAKMENANCSTWATATRACTTNTAFANPTRFMLAGLPATIAPISRDGLTAYAKIADASQRRANSAIT